MDPRHPPDAQRIVAAYLAVVEAHAHADVYPAPARDLPHSKETIRVAFKTATTALLATGQMSAELQEYLQVAYVSLADYVDDESVRLLREYREAGEMLSADRRLAREKADSEAWRRITEQSTLAGQVARAIGDEAQHLRDEFRSWRDAPA